MISAGNSSSNQLSWLPAAQDQATRRLVIILRIVFRLRHERITKNYRCQRD